jgi:hypothetical protein
MSFPSKQFSGIKYKKFICKICNQIPAASGKHKLVSTNCKHLYCEYCIKEKIKTDSKCPQCKNIINVKELQVPDQKLVELHRDLEIDCPFKVNGCQEKKALCKINFHSSKCPFNPEKSQNSLRNSGSEASVSDFSESSINAKLKRLTVKEDKFKSKSLIEDNKYSKEFIEECFLGNGSFAIVFKVKNKMSKKEYAIKRIPMIDQNEAEKQSKEIKLLENLKSIYVVKYIDSWIERNTFDLGDPNKTEGTVSSGHEVYQSKNKYLLHIQMEFCSTILKKVMEQLKSELKIEKLECLPKIAYVITCELFKEILESVNYLHNHKPPVIHRDLKPANILITDGSSGRFVKLGDFGLAVNHEFEDQSHTEGTGTLKYIAPEVFKSRKYGTKADIYSLGVILEDLFNIDSDMYSYFESCFLFSLLNFFP